MYEMTTLKHAFNAKDMNSLVYKILKGKVIVCCGIKVCLLLFLCQCDVAQYYSNSP